MVLVRPACGTNPHTGFGFSSTPLQPLYRGLRGWMLRTRILEPFFYPTNVPLTTRKRALCTSLNGTNVLDKPFYPTLVPLEESGRSLFQNMWYGSFMPAQLPLAAMREAELAVANAQEVRQHHRKRSERGDRQREHDLTLALKRVRAAMRPLRSEIGKFPYGPQTDQAAKNRDAIREASRALQRERRKLWKMTRRANAAAKR